MSLGMVESKLKSVSGIGQCVVFARSDKKQYEFSPLLVHTPPPTKL